jgi:hypothetical protein
MSYSRWSTGSWYVFWDSAMSGDLRENQHLACWYDMDEDHQISWSYERVDSLLQKHPETIIRMIQLMYDCSPDEANELQEYMQIWRTDVNREYNT